MKNVAILAFAALLVGCGGGGSSSGGPVSTPSPAPAPAPVAAKADGLYVDVGTARLQKVDVIIFGDLIVGLSGSVGSDGAMTRPDGALAGVGSQANGTYSANVNYYSSKPTMTGTLTGAYNAGTSFDGTLTINNQPQAFTGRAPASFNFNMPANLADIAGAWTMGSWQFAIDGSGLTTGKNVSEGCTLGGLIGPDKNKNVFVSSLKVSCVGGLSAQLTGLGATFVLPSGKRQLLITGLDTASGLSQGFAGVR